MAAQPFKVPELKIATAEVKEEKKEGPLFYILPPLVVLAVFIYCMVATPPAPAEDSLDSEDEAVLQMEADTEE
ncbi:MAG: hypothetical protein IKV82_00495 [Akkermansia sp.]|nr:hypothetical protein [Akkermansia sp.]